MKFLKNTILFFTLFIFSSSNAMNQSGNDTAYELQKQNLADEVRILTDTVGRLCEESTCEESCNELQNVILALEKVRQRALLLMLDNLSDGELEEFHHNLFLAIKELKEALEGSQSTLKNQEQENID